MSQARDRALADAAAQCLRNLTFTTMFYIDTISFECIAT